MALEGLIKKGKYITFRGTRWRVKREDAYPVSSSFKETQWTVSTHGGNTAFLLRTEENLESEVKEYWIWTKQVPLNSVDFLVEWKEWTPFTETGFPKAPPPRVRYKGTEYRFKGKNVGLMHNSDGDTATKVTWDYLNESGKRNLAVEIWKDDGRDYPEAYDGEIIDPAELQLDLPRSNHTVSESKPLRGLYRVEPAFKLKHVAALIGMPSFFFFVIGAGLDNVLYLAVPALLVVMLARSYTPLAWGICAATGMACAIPTFLINLTSFWIICAVCAFLSALIPTLILRKFEIPDDETPTFTAWGGVLPVVWLYSFRMYFHYAPKPFEVYELMMASVLPLIISSLSFGLILLTERMWRNRD